MRQYFVAAASFPQHVKHSILFFFSFILTIVYVFLSTFIYPVFLITFIHPVFFPNHFNSIEERERQTDRQTESPNIWHEHNFPTDATGATLTN